MSGPVRRGKYTEVDDHVPAASAPDRSPHYHQGHSSFTRGHCCPTFQIRRLRLREELRLSLDQTAGVKLRSVWIQALCSFLRFSLLPLILFFFFPSQSFYLPFPPSPSQGTCLFLPWENLFSQPTYSGPGELLFILQKPAWACPPGCLPDSARLGRTSLLGAVRSTAQTAAVQTSFRTVLGQGLVGRWVDT